MGVTLPELDIQVKAASAERFYKSLLYVPFTFVYLSTLMLAPQYVVVPTKGVYK